MPKYLTKEEAFKLSAEQGVSITHEFFGDEESMILLPNGNIEFEDGVQLSVEEFDKDRPEDYWSTGWSIYNYSPDDLEVGMTDIETGIL